jgi:hypothetical protein
MPISRVSRQSRSRCGTSAIVARSPNIARGAPSILWPRAASIDLVAASASSTHTENARTPASAYARASSSQQPTSAVGSWATTQLNIERSGAAGAIEATTPSRSISRDVGADAANNRASPSRQAHTRSRLEACMPRQYVRPRKFSPRSYTAPVTESATQTCSAGSQNSEFSRSLPRSASRTRPMTASSLAGAASGTRPIRHRSPAWRARRT